MTTATYTPPRFAQHDEDRIIDGFLALIESTGVALNDWLVDVGAHDGVTYSNVAGRILAGNRNAVLVEACERTAAMARHNWGDFEGVQVVAAKAGTGADDSVRSIVCPMGCPDDPDVLSIDIDGHDVHVWRASGMHAKVVCVEFNPTIPPGVVWFQPENDSRRIGSSLDALVLAANDLGYDLAAATPYNGIFVRRDLFRSEWVPDNSPARLRPSADLAAYVFHGYDGDVVVAGSLRSPWVERFDLRRVLGVC